jgi:hypothetical protein
MYGSSCSGVLLGRFLVFVVKDKIGEEVFFFVFEEGCCFRDEGEGSRSLDDGKRRRRRTIDPSTPTEDFKLLHFNPFLRYIHGGRSTLEKTSAQRLYRDSVLNEDHQAPNL